MGISCGTSFTIMVVENMQIPSSKLQMEGLSLQVELEILILLLPGYLNLRATVIFLGRRIMLEVVFIILILSIRQMMMETVYGMMDISLWVRQVQIILMMIMIFWY